MAVSLNNICECQFRRECANRPHAKVQTRRWTYAGRTGATLGWECQPPGFATRPGLGIVETLQGPYTSLPLIVFNWARQPSEDFRQLSAAAIIVLLAIILLLNAVAILLRNRFEKRW